MSADIPEKEPAEIISGDTCKWLVSLSDYAPSDGWTLTYTLVSTGSRKVQATATTSGTQFLTTISAATTANMAPGVWSYQGRVNNASESYTVRNGSIEVKRNFSDVQATLDTRTHAKKSLELIEAALEGRAVDGIDNHTIGGTSINLIPLERLHVLRNLYKAEVIREEQAEKLKRGIGGSRNVYVRFS